MNKSGCKDPTAELAIGKVTHKQKLPRDVKAFNKIVEGLAVLHGFTVLKPAQLSETGWERCINEQNRSSAVPVRPWI